MHFTENKRISKDRNHKQSWAWNSNNFLILLIPHCYESWVRNIENPFMEIRRLHIAINPITYICLPRIFREDMLEGLILIAFTLSKLIMTDSSDARNCWIRYVKVNYFLHATYFFNGEKVNVSNLWRLQSRLQIFLTDDAYGRYAIFYEAVFRVYF